MRITHAKLEADGFQPHDVAVGERAPCQRLRTRPATRGQLSGDADTPSSVHSSDRVGHHPIRIHSPLAGCARAAMRTPCGNGPPMPRGR